MPVVPRNTLSEPAHVRSPELFVAKPRMAEAMQSVTSAMGARASAIGRNASIQGAIAEEYGRQGEIRQRIAQENLRGKQYVFSGIENLGAKMMQTGFDLDRIADRRAEEEANVALASFTNDMNRRTAGYEDPQTGALVPGTFSAPYSPEQADKPASGPSIATARAVKEAMEDENGPVAKLSPRARAKFDQKAAVVYQSMMANASKIEYDQIQAYRQQNQKNAIEAKRDMMMNVHGEPGDASAFWSDAVSQSKELAAYGMETMRRDANGNFSDPQAQTYYDNGVGDYLKMFAKDRIDAMMAKARIEPNDERRDAMLSSAIETAAYKAGDRHLFDDAEFAKIKLDASDVRAESARQKMEAAGAAIKEAESEFGHLYSGRKTDPERLNQLKAAIPPAEFARLEQKAADAQTADEVSAFRGQLEIYESQRNVLQVPGDTAKDRIAVQIASMRSPVARATALNLLRDADRKWAEGQSTDAKSAQAQAEARTASNAALIVENGGALAPDGTWRPMSEAQQIDTLIALGKTGSLQPKEYFALKEKIAKRRPTDDEHLKTIWQTIGSEIGHDRVAEHFAFKDGMVEFGNVSPKGRELRPNDDLGDVEYAGSDAEGEAWSNEVDARADLVRTVAQNALEYARQIPASGRPDEKGNRTPPMSVADFVKKSLRPEDNEAARRWTEANVRLNAIRMRDTTTKMEQWLKSQEFDAFADKE